MVSRKEFIGLCFLIANSLTGSALARDLCPPESSVLVSSHGRVPFYWPGSAKEYFLQVKTAGKTVYEGSVKGNSTTLDLSLNRSYRWNVAPLTNGLGGSGETHAFQLNDHLSYNFDGGPAKSDNSPEAERTVSGKAGTTGQNGQNVSVELRPGPVPDKLTQISLQTERMKSSFYLLRGSDQLIISSRGGDGSAGQTGGQGNAAFSNPTLPNGYSAATSGGPGGPGGRGGDGGKVNLVTNGIDWKPLFKFILDGGRGGPGGLGGLGGSANSGPIEGTINATNSYHGAGSIGRSGPKGPDGKSGNIHQR